MKDVVGFEGLYKVTSCGKIWSCRQKKFMKVQTDKDGYLRVGLKKDGKGYNFAVHRLVAEAYIPNPENKPTVNHLDEVKTNNCINNLTWATMAEQNVYGDRLEKVRQKKRKLVYCVELDQIFVGTQAAADALGVCAETVRACCRGKLKTCKRMHLYYVDKEVAANE